MSVLQKFWYDRTIRTQLLIAIGLINLCAFIVAGVISILNARHATRVEMEAALEIAKRFVRVTIQAITPDGKIQDLSKKINQLSSHLALARLRHVRIYVADASGNLVQLSPREDAESGIDHPERAPRWFAALVAPEVRPQTLSVVMAEPSAGTVLIVEQPADAVPKVWSFGTVVIAGEPEDEIAEVWQDVSSVALIWLSLDLLILGILYLVLGRMLDPLARLARGLFRLEDGHYTTRLALPRIKELAAISERFNRLAEALSRSRAENARLYGQLITVQENERREVANELHDEASPCLFGVMANALSIGQLVRHRRDRKADEIRQHVDEILKVTERLKLMNRALLKKLRPVALGRVALSALVEDLVGELQRRYPEVTLARSIKIGSDSYGEAVDLAVYRCIQEGVTNAIQHGQARSIRIELRSREGENAGGAPGLELTIEDDGRGIPADVTLGFGLTAMRERINAQGGSCIIESSPGQGATLRAVIPIRTHTEPVAQAEPIGVS